MIGIHHLWFWLLVKKISLQDANTICEATGSSTAQISLFNALAYTPTQYLAVEAYAVPYYRQKGLTMCPCLIKTSLEGEKVQWIIYNEILDCREHQLFIENS